mmetsp:Transcript_19263/g.54634  ORF Transcript_19263/g.54634 Transcript_19263/m.54634 type:complete len:229 (-) Transcript_19263:71-757(-)
METETLTAPNPPAADTLKPLPRASELLFANAQQESKFYWDRSHYNSPEAQIRALEDSSTLYIGNLAFSTRSHHIRTHFAQLGPVKTVVLGLDRFRKTPCGFCFVEYRKREDALLAIANLSGTKLDGRIIRVELDAGFIEGRQFGRGASGGQVRDDRRNKSDPGRQAKARSLNWIPPEKVRSAPEGDAPQGQQGQNQADYSYYGTGDKRGMEDDGESERAEKNPRFRED